MPSLLSRVESMWKPDELQQAAAKRDAETYQNQLTTVKQYCYDALRALKFGQQTVWVYEGGYGCKWPNRRGLRRMHQELRAEFNPHGWEVRLPWYGGVRLVPLKESKVHQYPVVDTTKKP